ncbi:ribonuclease H, partial [Trifolium pratense]
MAGNMSKGIMSNCITDFQALKEFNIVSHVGPAPKIQEVIWSFPPTGWIKANTDGAARGSPGHASAGGIFRDSSGGIKGCFSLYLGIQSSLFAE